MNFFNEEMPVMANDFIPEDNGFGQQAYAETARTSEAERRKTRYIVFCGDVMAARFKRDFKGAKIGGEHFGGDFKTLQTTNGLVRRCQITPLTVGFDDLNPHSLGDKISDAKQRQVFDKLSGKMTTIYYVDCLPGDEIGGIIQSDSDKGIREVEILRGVEMEEGSTPMAMQIQKEIFPDWVMYFTGVKTFFPTVAALESYLTDRRFEVSDTAKSVIDTMLESTAQYRRWGTSYLDAMSRLVKSAPTAGGSVYSWSQLALELFDQLGLNKDEFLMRKIEAPKQVDNIEMDELRGFMAILAKREVERVEMVEVAKAMAEPVIAEAPEEVLPEARICADVNGRGEPCKGRAVKVIDGKPYCAAHPKE